MKANTLHEKFNVEYDSITQFTGIKRNERCKLTTKATESQHRRCSEMSQVKLEEDQTNSAIKMTRFPLP